MQVKVYVPQVIEVPSEYLPALAKRAADSLGITEGVVKGDVVVHDGRPHVIEVAARLSGGYFCTHEVPLNTGVDLVGNAIRLAVGDPVDPADLRPRFNRHLGQRYLFPGTGRVVSIDGQADVAAWPGVELLEIRVRPGDTLRSVDSHPARAGLVLVSGESRSEVIDLAERAIGAIEVVMEPA